MCSPSVSEAEPGAYDAVVECVGRPELVQACQPALRPRGRLVVSGACAEPTTIEPITALLKELTVRYSVAYSIDEFREVVAAFSHGDIDPAPTVGPTFGLDQVAEAFDAVRDAQAQRPGVGDGHNRRRVAYGFFADVVGGHTGDHRMQILFQAFGAVQVGQPVGQPEQESTQKGDHGECLLLDQFPVGWCANGLGLCDGRFADRDELIHQAVENHPEFGVTRRRSS